MLPAPPSSCQATMPGTVLLAMASRRNVVIQLTSHREKLGPWMGRESLARTSLNVRAQPASKFPALAVSHVQSGSFHSSHAAMSVAPELRTLATCVSTADSQLLQLTQR